MNLFPSTDFRKEFHFYPEIEKVVERAVDLFSSIVEPGEAFTIKTILSNPAVTARVIASLESLDINNPFFTNDPRVEVAIVAAMANEGVSVEHFDLLERWTRPSVLSGCRRKRSEELWVNLAFQDRNTSLFRILNEANSRLALKEVSNPFVSVFAAIQKKDLPALVFVLHRLLLGDKSPLEGVSIDFGDENTLRVILAMDHQGNPCGDAYSEDQLEAAIAEMWEYSQNHSWFEKHTQDYVLGKVMPAFMNSWLSRGVPVHSVVDWARSRIRLFLRASGLDEPQADSVQRVIMACLLFPMTDFFNAFIEDPYDLLGIDISSDESIFRSMGEVRFGVTSPQYNHEQGYQIGVQLQKVGVDLSSVRAMRRVGFQRVSKVYFAAQSINPTRLEDRYKPFLTDSKIPLWVHNGHEFNPELSSDFLADLIKQVRFKAWEGVSIGGVDFPNCILLNSLIQIDSDRVHAFVVALDAVGALDGHILHNLDLDAESYGLERVAALSAKGRGAFVSQAVGL